jgi:hypothetical protein
MELDCTLIFGTLKIGNSAKSMLDCSRVNGTLKENAALLYRKVMEH